MKKLYISSSFRDLATTRVLAEQLAQVGFEVGFSEPGDPEGIEGCLGRIDRVEGVCISNPRGEVGKSVALDLGYALGRGKALFSTHPVTDPPIGHRIRPLSELMKGEA